MTPLTFFYTYKIKDFNDLLSQKHMWRCQSTVLCFNPAATTSAWKGPLPWFCLLLHDRGAWLEKFQDDQQGVTTSCRVCWLPGNLTMTTRLRWSYSVNRGRVAFFSCKTCSYTWHTDRSVAFSKRSILHQGVKRLCDFVTLFVRYSWTIFFLLREWQWFMILSVGVGDIEWLPTPNC